MNQMDNSSVISLRDVSYKIRERKILDDISWDVKKGEHWAILGLNGSGKTTILKMITGYLWPHSGQISVLGHLYGKVNIPELRKSIGWVSTSLDDNFQTAYSDSTLEIVLSGKFASIGLYEEVLEEDIERAYEIMEHLNIRHLSNQKLLTLSQGEKRKVMIGRALMASPKLLILDEACNGLDIYAKEELLGSVERLIDSDNGPTLLYVTHHVEEIVPSISNVLLINSGRIVAEGKKRSKLTESLLERTFQLPVAVDWENGRPWIRIKSTAGSTGSQN